MSIFPGTLALCSIACLFFAGWLAWKKGAAAAAVMATLFVASACLAYMPQLDMFKAFSVEVRLHNTLDRADEIIGRLHRMSVANGRIAYRTEAINLFLNVDPKALQRDLDAVAEELKEAGVGEEELRTMRTPYVETIGTKLRLLAYSITFNTFNNGEGGKYYASKSDADPVKIRINKLVPSASDEVNKEFEDFASWKSSMERIYPGNLLPINQERTFRDFWDRLEKVYGDCISLGRVTDDAVPLIKLSGMTNSTSAVDSLWRGSQP